MKREIPIIGISPGYPGAGRVLSELAKVYPSSVKYYDLSAEQILIQPDALILAAWHPEYPRLIDSLRPGKTILLWTSPLLQTELVPQELDFINRIQTLIRTKKVHAVWCGSPGTVGFFLGKGFYAPYPVSLPRAGVHVPKPPIRMSLFGPMHPRKNVLAQLLAYGILAEQSRLLTLHITDSSAMELARKVGLQVSTDWNKSGAIDHGWLPEVEYGKILEVMDVGLQVSVPGVESFSYVAWDHISRGIPCLTTVPWAPEKLQVREWNSPQAIARQAEEVTFFNPKPFAEGYAKWANGQVKDRLEALGLPLNQRAV